MPFEPAPKESPAARLAALIELGRIANPDLRFNSDIYFGACSLTACAMGFACLASGATRDWHGSVRPTLVGLRDELGHALCNRVEAMASKGASLDAICLSLREGELAKVTA